MITTPTAVTAVLTHADPFAGLTETDATRIAAAMAAAVTESTRTTYGHSWRRWERWCADRGVTPLPAAPAAVCAYITERAADGASASGIDTACSAISYTHRSHGLADPILTEGVRQVRRGLRRTLGTAPPPDRITGHSLRAGHATTAAAAGVPLDRIALQTRHKRLSTLIERYIRPAQALDATSSRDLGL